MALNMSKPEIVTNPKEQKAVAKMEPKFTVIEKVLKGETFLVMAQSAIELEDEFSSLYYTASNKNNLFLMPPFEPNVLLNLTKTNNILNQCIEAMEVNIDGTGHEFVAVEKDGKPDEAEKKEAEAFFREPYPETSFVDIRRKLRRSMEAVGYGFIEVLRNVGGDVVGLRSVETNHVRMVKLDTPIRVKKTLMRNGKEVELEMWIRERRFAQRVALSTNVYYREFGTTRQINWKTGAWEEPGAIIKPEERGTELLMFGVHPDTQTPYFLPRWINQLPSVVGSRSAEEQNLEFLDAGGMPPAIIFVQGGAMMKGASDQLRMYLSGKNKNKNRAVVVEVQANSGALDSNQRVDVKTERFGAERAQDAMFMKYDESTEEHVRTGFRLPPLFLGKAQDYNFATAQTGYMVAEAQVFLPERISFDEKINRTIMKELKFKTIQFKSKPITLKDVATQLKGLELSKEVADRESFLKEINTASGMDLQMAEVGHEAVPAGAEAPPGKTVSEIPGNKLPAAHTGALPSPQPEKEEPGEPAPDPKTVEHEQHMHSHDETMAEHQQALAKIKLDQEKERLKQLKKGPAKKSVTELMDLAYDYATIKGLVQKRDLPIEQVLKVEEEVENLSAEYRPAFNRLLAQYAFGNDSEDLIDIAAHA